MPPLTRLAPGALLVGGLALASALAGCGRSPVASSHGTGDPTTLRLVQPDDPTRFDPHQVQDGATIEILMHVAEGLVQWDTNSQVAPCLAERWEVSPDRRTYTFHLRRNVRFHNGRTLTADDVVYSLNRAATLPESPVASTYLDDIVGFSEVAGKPGRTLRGVRAVDEHTVAITITRPVPYFLMKLTYPTGYVLAREAVADLDREMNERDLVGTGPFRIAEYRQGHHVLLEAFPDYWGGAPRLRRISRRIVGDPATRHAMFESGEVDLLVLTMADAEQDQRVPALRERMRQFDRASVFYLGLNQVAYPPFRDRRVRRAFALAVDRQAINQSVMMGFTTPAYGVIPKGIEGFDPDFRGLPFAPDQAKQLLAEAGYPGGSGLPPLTLYFSDHYPDARRVCEAVAEMIRQNLGVTLALRNVEWTQYLRMATRRELPFFHIRWAADYPDPQNFLNVLLHSRAQMNFSGYRNPEFDRLVEQAETEPDAERRRALYRQAERLAVEDAPWIPLYFQRDVELWNPKLRGVRSSLMGHLPHLTTYLEP